MTAIAVATVDAIPIRSRSSRARTVLVLNASFEPLRPVHLKRAMSLLVNGRAVVHEDDGTGRYLTNAGRDQLWPWPKVLLLTRYVKVARDRMRRTPDWTKRGVLERDGFICGYCREPGAGTVDHITPVSQGGKSTWRNTVAACQPCNGRKANRTPQEAGMPLLATPYVPRRW